LKVKGKYCTIAPRSREPEKAAAVLARTCTRRLAINGLSPSPETMTHPTRREFALALAAAAAAACAPRATTATPAATPLPTPTTPGTVTSAAPPPPPPPGTEELVAFIRTRYGKVLPAEQIAQLSQPVGHVIDLADRLGKTPVPNDVDPFSVCPMRVGGAP
jgi:hypothetical protein